MVLVRVLDGHLESLAAINSLTRYNAGTVCAAHVSRHIREDGESAFVLGYHLPPSYIIFA